MCCILDNVKGRNDHHVISAPIGRKFSVFELLDKGNTVASGADILYNGMGKI